MNKNTQNGMEDINMEAISSVIVSWDFSHGRDHDLALVGKMVDGSVQIINAFQGPEARNLVEKIITKKEDAKNV